MSFYGMATSDHSQHTQYWACQYNVWDHPYFHKCYDCEYSHVDGCDIYHTYLVHLHLTEGLEGLGKHLEEMERLRNEAAEGPYEEHSESFLKHIAKFY